MADLQTNLQRLQDNASAIESLVTDIESTITTKGGTVTPNAGLRGIPDAIDTIPTGDGENVAKKDVNFYDYNGIRVMSYAAEEFLALSELPANPSHEGLTAQGWNWSLADAKEYVTDYGMLDIGQMYVTDDGKTRLYITLNDGRLKPYLGLIGNSVGTAVNIDWGDGSALESVTLDTSMVYTPHEYASGGDYVIKIEVTSGKLGASNAYTGNRLIRGSKADYSDASVYYAAVRKIELGNNISMIWCQFARDLAKLSTISIPSYIPMIANQTFQGSGLPFIVFPSNNSCNSVSSSAFSGSSIEKTILTNHITTISGYSMGGGFTSVQIPNSVTKIDSYAMMNCQFLSNLILPKSITNIEANAFNGCKNLGFIKFTPTTPATIANANAWTGIPSDCYILVPYDTLDDYLNETNMPDDSVYLYLCYATYADGVTLPTVDSVGYNLTWYATKDDARNGTNPITIGNGKEIYAIGV